MFNSNFISSKQNIIMLLLSIFFLVYILYFNKNDTVCIMSSYNNNIYTVANYGNIYEASNVLGEVNKNIVIFSEYLNNNISTYSDSQKKYIKQLSDRINNIIIEEYNYKNDEHVSFTDNKGERIVLCIRDRHSGEFHDSNIITYVLLHELAHIACPEIGHTKLFEEIFIFFLKVATKMGIYIKKSYKKNPQKYCGSIIIDEDIY
jgi:hypothetical protein